MASAPAASKLIPGLFMGSQRAIPRAGKFNVLVCAAEELEQPHNLRKDIEYIHVPLIDRTWNFQRSPKKIMELIDLTADIADMVRQKFKVLIYCNMGMNRSGLISGLTLLHLGYTADAVIRIIRRRSRCALNNQSFVDLIEYADIYLI
jgi:protein-tyrosine phosphatase